MNKITINYIGAVLMGGGAVFLWGLEAIPLMIGLYIVINSSFASEEK